MPPRNYDICYAPSLGAQTVSFNFTGRRNVWDIADFKAAHQKLLDRSNSQLDATACLYFSFFTFLPVENRTRAADESHSE